MNVTHQYLVIAIATMVVLWPTPSHSDVISIPENECYVGITGSITREDIHAIRNVKCEVHALAVTLGESPGGDAGAAMEIGRWLRAREAIVRVAPDTACHSSCALIFISGVIRMNYGDIGLHRPYLSGRPRSDAAVRAATAEMHHSVRQYVEEMGVTPGFTDIMLNTPPDQVRIYRRDQIYSLVPEHDPIFDEVRTSRQARNYGVSVEEYRRREWEANRSCDGRMSIKESLECHDAILWGLSRGAYTDRDSEVTNRCRSRTPSLSDDDFRSCQINVMHGR